MKFNKYFGFVLGAFVCFSIHAKTTYLNQNPTDIIIPRLSSLSDSALKVNLMADNLGNSIPDADCKAFAQLYWKNTSLFVSVTIIDDSITSSDNVELFFVEKRGGKNLVQFFISGLNKDSANCTLWDFRGVRKLVDIPVNFKLATKHEVQKTVLNFEMSLFSIGITQPIDSEMGIQIVVADLDQESKGKKQSLSWSFSNDTYRNSFATVPVKLGHQKSIDIKETFKIYWDKDTSLMVNYISDKPSNITFFDDFSGKELKSKSTTIGNKTIYQLMNAGNRKEATRQLIVKKDNVVETKIEYAFIPKNLLNIKLKDMEEELDRFQFLDYGKILRPDVLFIGHSMFRYWASIEDDFKGINVLNRAFGGSRLELLLNYYDNIIIPYQPKTIVLFNGINDINVGDSPENAFAEFKTLVSKIHTDLPQTRLLVLPHFAYKYASIPNLKKFDDLIIDYVQKSDWIQLVDVRNALPTNFDTLKTCLFPDFTHVNAKGYTYLAPIIIEQLSKK